MSWATRPRKGSWSSLLQNHRESRYASIRGCSGWLTITRTAAAAIMRRQAKTTRTRVSSSQSGTTSPTTQHTRSPRGKPTLPAQRQTTRRRATARRRSEKGIEMYNNTLMSIELAYPIRHVKSIYYWCGGDHSTQGNTQNLRDFYFTIV